jgi:hypothetical protein
LCAREKGFHESITVTATKIDQTQKAVVAIEAWNTLGSVTDFDPVMVRVYGASGPTTEALSDVPATEHVQTIANGNLGLSHLHIDVNGRMLVLPLKDTKLARSTCAPG